jgi:FtsP/CotA-like multicopper oxidase with cupredoxin domain
MFNYNIIKNLLVPHTTRKSFAVNPAYRFLVFFPFNQSYYFYFSCTGVLRYSTTSRVPTNLSSYPVPSLPSEADLRAFTYSQPYQTLLDIDQMPKRSADKEIILNNAEYATGTPGNFSLRWRINNASLDETRLANLTRPLLFDVYNGIDKTLPTDVVYSIRQNQIIDIVLQNTVATPGICEAHPFHLHGHKFWVHSQGTGLYNASANKILNSNNPVFRDTVILYPTSQIYTDPHTQLQNYQKPCGWTKIRFIADNPGLWLLHCHIGAHAFIGMTVLFNEDPEHLVMNYMSQN